MPEESIVGGSHVGLWCRIGGGMQSGICFLVYLLWGGGIDVGDRLFTEGKGINLSAGEYTETANWEE